MENIFSDKTETALIAERSAILASPSVDENALRLLESEAARRLDDRILVFYDGTILEEVKPENFREGRNLKEPYTQALYRALPEHEFFGGE